MASITKNKKGERRIIVNLRTGERKSIYLGRMPLKYVDSIKTKVEAIVSANLSCRPVEQEVAEWLGTIGAELHRKLSNIGLVDERDDGKRKSTTLKAFVDAYLASRTDAKQSTLTFFGHTRRCLIAFFGPKKHLAAITVADAEKFRRWLKSHENLAPSTVRRRCTAARQFFKEAVNDRLICERRPNSAAPGEG